MKRYHPLPINSRKCDMLIRVDGDFVLEEEAQAVIDALKAQLAKRDKLLEQSEAAILEQQARIEEMLDVGACMRTPNDLPALEAALKAERIKTLEDAAGHFSDTPKGREVKEELTRMANALKEQS